ncbi:hypothetical protein [Wenyingzhuangia sp. 2_MG-2023]|uniref:hypothetical protein n=1 Tax=Wenyingzhuangia sp. 2_MG-2023 TaxID=3062639 RepID=UPI0026E209B9|nr:hypothetical protein [Wenyingzhuangia sp. 2_MG-2023]MDO6737462.1 hypothetical protein [Wenyingzhuangia sp. 2_MG-2023]
MKKTLSYLIIILVISSCSRKINPTTAYSELKVNEVKKDNLILTELELNNPIKAELKIEDNVMSNDSVLSYYHEYKYTPNKTKNYSVEIFSLCNCFGFKKYIFNPNIKILDKNNNEIKNKIETISYDYQKGPISFNKKWTFESVKNEPLTIIIYSENNKLGEPIHKFEAYTTSFAAGMIIPIVAPITIKSSLVGKYYIELTESTVPNNDLKSRS